MARFPDHPEGLDPVDLKEPVRRILGRCTDFRALTGRQGDIAFAHPFMLHTASVKHDTASHHLELVGDAP